ncbi:MAG: 16S rRNA (cytosine(1402)-N(4))-methyltransferase [Gemmatimonadetes bacterium]|nr:16S rRNA (cytosine(1402)-N(4))-methyltransferase [Gemmatimonadota bacterium]
MDNNVDSGWDATSHGITKLTDFHKPVLLVETISWIKPNGEGFYLDGTVGGGGHSRLLLDSCKSCKLVAVDRDPQALSFAKTVLKPYGDRVRFVHARFDQALDEISLETPLAGALLDLGVSSHQLDDDQRGFTFRKHVSLDMRMDCSDADPLTATQILNEAREEELEKIFRDYGEEPRARKLAYEIVSTRQRKPFVTSNDLVAVLQKTFHRAPKNKEKARIFQALRITVNDELGCLKRGLKRIRVDLDSGASFAVITYHSLEDRIVKRLFREWSQSCICPPKFPVCNCRGKALGHVPLAKGITPSDLEIQQNSRARSARLRVWRKA